VGRAVHAQCALVLSVLLEREGHQVD
jgi:hypothetical protein